MSKKISKNIYFFECLYIINIRNKNQKPKFVIFEKNFRQKNQRLNKNKE